MYIQPLKEEQFDTLIQCYCDYFNTYENGNWSYDLCFQRISQFYNTPGSIHLVMYDKEQMIGYLNGYELYFDDGKGLLINELVIFQPYQNQGYGSLFLEEVKKMSKAKGIAFIELMTKTDDKHLSFYYKNGYKKIKNFTMMGLRIEDENK